ncbi:EmrB/QacA subfamily drug resistance transporter [Pseudogracilibacillus auburnensis]|uniref:EmrB/QacA subfamily drug resistance transporter n=2 Tax=Pseudogracilibacillus auburnensis TaxID=1494959 RepID=A0A2V3WC03_9BACI|nr:DHA2 family efflux MFS transporter permease subunit [Pseudogracilibacillus auburnensis]PXW90571.1 EmrB/QacA subfamily drug resistance transporter [Pseudogracilibacillus auburnensis]
MFTTVRIRLLAVTCGALFMAMLDNLVLSVALPTIQQSLQASFTDLQWIMNAYMFAFAVLLIPFSMMGDRFGRKRVFLIGLLVFTVGSALCALSGSPLQLILSRAIQGIGGAAIVPLSLTLVNLAFPKNKRAAALGIWSGVSGLGLSIGPLVGGLIVEGLSWSLIFWLNVPVGLLSFVLGLFWLEESKGEQKPINFPGVALLVIGLLGIVYGLEEGSNAGWGAQGTLLPLVAGGILLVLFYFWERKRPVPYIRFELFRSSKYTAYVLGGFWMLAGIFGAIFLLSLFLQQAQGYSALEAGIRMMAWTTCSMIAAPLSGMAVTRLGARNVLIVGFLMQTLALVGFAWLIAAQGTGFPFVQSAPLLMLAGTGMGLSFTPLAHGVLSSVSDSSVGEASGVSNASRELGGVFGIALVGIFFNADPAIATPADYSEHIVPVLQMCAGMLGLGLIILFFGTRERVGRKAGVRTAGTRG